eukprot:jgi/Bigna1/66411/fgenesh1_pg.1_\
MIAFLGSFMKWKKENESSVKGKLSNPGGACLCWRARRRIGGMNGIPYIDELIKEYYCATVRLYMASRFHLLPLRLRASFCAISDFFESFWCARYLLFRGYMQTFSAFTAEQSRDITRVARVEPIVKMIFMHIGDLDLPALNRMWKTLVSRIFSQIPAAHDRHSRQMRASLLKLYLVTAVKKGQKRAIDEFFRLHASELAAASGGDDEDHWRDWLALPYISNPREDSRFAACFEDDWAALVEVSLRNLLTTAFQEVSLPLLLAFNLQRLESRARHMEMRGLKARIDALNFKLSLCKTDERGAGDARASARALSNEGNQDIKSLEMKGKQHDEKQGQKQGGGAPIEQAGRGKEGGRGEGGGGVSPLVTEGGGGGEEGYRDKIKQSRVAPHFLQLSVIPIDGKHKKPIRSLKFSGDGRRLAIGGTDGTLKVWQLSKDLLSSSPVSSRLSPYPPNARRALQFSHVEAAGSEKACELQGTVFCRSAIGALEWDTQTDELLLCGSHDSKARHFTCHMKTIQLWSASQRRVLRTTTVSRDPAGRVVALACSPKRPLFVVALNHGGDATSVPSSPPLSSPPSSSSSSLDGTGGMLVAIHSCVFNHNGNMILAGGSDGVVRIFETASDKPIMSWPALAEGARQLSCVRFSVNETTVLTASAGSGVIDEWSLHKLGKPVRSYLAPDIASSSADQSGQRWYEIALDSEGHHFISTSGAPLRCTPPPPFTSSSSSSSLRTRGNSNRLTQKHPGLSSSFSLYRRKLTHGPQGPPPPSPAMSLLASEPPSKGGITADNNKSHVGASTSKQTQEQSLSKAAPSTSDNNMAAMGAHGGGGGGETKQGRMGSSRIVEQALDEDATGGSYRDHNNNNHSVVARGRACAQVFNVGQREPVQQLPHGNARAVTAVDWHPTLDIVASAGDDGSVRLSTLLLVVHRDAI